MKKYIIKLLQKIINFLQDYPYCCICGTCGETGCCGIERFLDNHVKGKTNCLYEEDMIEEIKEIYENTI